MAETWLSGLPVLSAHLQVILSVDVLMFRDCQRATGQKKIAFGVLDGSFITLKFNDCMSTYKH